MQAQTTVASWAGLLAFAVIGGLVLIFAFVLVLVLLNMAQRRREWAHLERLKSHEMGRPLPNPQSDWARALVCIAIGAGVPSVAFLVTALATTYQKVDPEVWLAPVIVGTAAVYYGYCLASTLF